VIAALGITWILDGLEVTMVGSVAAVLTDPKSELGFTQGQVDLAGGIYIAGACTGALFYSYLTGKYWRKTLFIITLGMYLIFTVVTAFSWNVWSFVVFRFFTGAGIGGEYSAIYSAKDELIPARLRCQGQRHVSDDFLLERIEVQHAAIRLGA
jgi:MFS family permease